MSTLRELRLMRMMARQNIKIEENPPEPTEAERAQYLTTAMYMLAYLGAIDMALYDLVADVEAAGLYRHSLKHTINNVSKVVAQANGLANSILRSVNNGVRVRRYTDMYEYAYNAIQQSILIEPPHRSYSIIKALSRLFIDAYNKVGAKTNHHYLKDVAKILPRIDIPELKDYNIDCIISKAVQIELGKQDA